MFNFLVDPNVAALLIALGILLLAIEIATPGIQVAGVLGAISLLVGGWALQQLPAGTGAWVFFLLVAGLVFLVALLGWAIVRGRKKTRKALERLGGDSDLGLHGFLGQVEAVDPSGRRGKALIRGEVWDVILSEEQVGELRVGDSVRVVAIKDFHVVVARV